MNQIFRRQSVRLSFMLLLLFGVWTFTYLGPAQGILPVQAAVATDGTDDGQRPPVENPPPVKPTPPVTVKPPVVQPPTQPAGPAVSLSDAKLRNEDKEGNALSDYKISFDYEETRWISYSVRLTNNTGERLRGKLGIRYLQPDGKLKQNSKSPTGYTFEQDIDMATAVDVTGGWGNAAGGTFEPGRHRIEFWWGGQRIHQMTFAVSEPEYALKIKSVRLRNETRDRAALSDFGRVFDQNDVQYISFHLQLENTTPLLLNGKLGVKYFKPDGTMMRGNGSPEGYTQELSLTVKDFLNISNGWGSSSGNVFGPGRHRIEFWWDGKQIGRAFFEIR